MMLTEAEAATKRCPLSFGPPFSESGMMTHAVAPMPYPGYGGGYAYAPQATSPMNCVGSRCMGWRVGVAAKPAVRGPIIGVETRNDGEPKAGGATYYGHDQAPAEPEKGFCGQFGVPR